MKKMEKMMQGKATKRGSNGGLRKPGSMPNMPPPPPYDNNDAKYGSSGEDGKVSVKEKFLQLLLKDDVRQALSRFLAQPEVVLLVQHLLVALYSESFHRMQEHTSRIIPLLLKLGSEAPALLGLIPMLTEICVPGKDRRSSVSNNGPWQADSDTSTRRSQENPYSDAHFPPPPPGFWGRGHFPPHRSEWGAPPVPHYFHRQRKQFCKRRGQGAHWHKHNCGRKWGNPRYSQAATEATRSQSKRVSVVSPKKEIDIVVDAIAPEKPGRYIHYWRLYDENDVPFGDRIWLDMVVVLEKPAVDRPDEVLNDFKTGNQCPQSELNARVVKKVSTCVAKEELKKDVDVSESTAAEATESPPLGVIEEKDDKDNNAKPAEIEDGKEKEQQDDISDILSNTSSSLSHPDEQWDLLHSNNFVDDFVTSSKSMVQVEKFKKQ